MWWQALPPWLITGGLISSCYITIPTVVYVFTGKPCQRFIQDGYSFEYYARHGYRRDVDMCGNENTSKGLENIPDDDD